MTLPLTPDGIASKQDELYALSDNELLVEARAICHNLLEWVETRFDLTPEQSEYLDGVPDNVLFGWGAQLAAIVISRGNLYVEMIPPTNPRRTKQTDLSCEGAIIYKPEGASELNVQGSYTETLP